MEERTAKEILTTLLDSLGLTSYEFARAVGVTPQSVGDILRGRVRRISLRLSEKICAKFTSINPRWLRLGEGEMYLYSLPNITQTNAPSHDTTPNANHINNCANCPLVKSMQEQINRLLTIIENMQK